MQIKQNISTQQSINERPDGDGWERPEAQIVDLARSTLTTPFLERAFEFFLPALLTQNGWDSGEVFLTSSGENGMARLFGHGNPQPVLVTDNLRADILAKLIKKRTIILHKGSKTLHPQLSCGLVLGLRANTKLYGLLSLGRKTEKVCNSEESDRLQGLADWLGTLIAHERERSQAERESVRGERERIGMDLHDGIIQSLYGIGLSLQNVRMHSTTANPEVTQAIEHALNGLDKAVGDIRNYILNLRPRELSGKSLLDSMRSLTREFRANTFIDVELEGSDNETRDLAESYAEALFHIYQEALSNVAKHAQASKVSVKIWRTGERLMLRVVDDGNGIDPAQRGKRVGHGVANMQTRAEAVGGGIELISIRKQGTTLRAWVPYCTSEAENA